MVSAATKRVRATPGSFVALAAALAALAVLAAAAPPARAVTPGQAIAALNAERAAHGIPAGIVETPAWSTACARHDDYQRANDGQLTHHEDPDRPGYTPTGAWAGANAVLAAGDSWATGNPWKTAPIHLAQLLSPRLAAMGIDDAPDFSCATTFPGYTRPSPPADLTYTFPGNGTTAVPTSELAGEGPYTPGQQVGIPAGSTTGPYLLVFFDGPGIYYSGGGSEAARLTSATLTGPAGQVAVSKVDNTTPGLAGYLPSGGQVIPLAPLAPHASYQVHVTGELVSSPTRRFDRTWTFRTGEGDGTGTGSGAGSGAGAGTGTGTGAARPKLSLRAPRRSGHRVRMAVNAGPALVGRSATVTLRLLRRRCPRCALRGYGRVGRSRIKLSTRNTLVFALPRRGEGVRLRIATAAFTAGGRRFAATRVRRRYVRH